MTYHLVNFREDKYIPFIEKQGPVENVVINSDKLNQVTNNEDFDTYIRPLVSSIKFTEGSTLNVDSAVVEASKPNLCSIKVTPYNAINVDDVNYTWTYIKNAKTGEVIDGSGKATVKKLSDEGNKGRYVDITPLLSEAYDSVDSKEDVVYEIGVLLYVDTPEDYIEDKYTKYGRLDGDPLHVIKVNVHPGKFTPKEININKVEIKDAYKDEENRKLVSGFSVPVKDLVTAKYETYNDEEEVDVKYLDIITSNRNAVKVVKVNGELHVKFFHGGQYTVTFSSNRYPHLNAKLEFYVVDKPSAPKENTEEEESTEKEPVGENTEEEVAPDVDLEASEEKEEVTEPTEADSKLEE